MANAEEPLLPVTSAVTLADTHASEVALARRAIGGAAGGGGVALLLCAIGLYAIVAFAVGQRAHEIGVRTALGADRVRIVRFFFLRGLRLSLAGLGVGLGLSLVVLRVVALAQGQETDPEVWKIAASTAALVVAAASLAAWIPARRAAGVDPLAMLHAE